MTPTVDPFKPLTDLLDSSIANLEQLKDDMTDVNRMLAEMMG